jgi:hypothetical protein
MEAKYRRVWSTPAGSGGGTSDALTGLVALSTFKQGYAWGQLIALLSF